MESSSLPFQRTDVAAPIVHILWLDRARRLEKNHRCTHPMFGISPIRISQAGANDLTKIHNYTSLDKLQTEQGLQLDGSYLGRAKFQSLYNNTTAVAGQLHLLLQVFCKSSKQAHGKEAVDIDCGATVNKLLRINAHLNSQESTNIHSCPGLLGSQQDTSPNKDGEKKKGASWSISANKVTIAGAVPRGIPTDRWSCPA